MYNEHTHELVSEFLRELPHRRQQSSAYSAALGIIVEVKVKPRLAVGYRGMLFSRQTLGFTP